MPIVTIEQQKLKWPEIGRVRKGAPKEPNRPGRDLEYFRIDSPNPEVMRRFTEAFGPQPKEFSAILPYGAVDDVLIANYERWDGATLLARGDGMQVNRWYDPQANAYRSDPLRLDEYNARFGVANPEKEWKAKALLFLLVPQAVADSTAGVLALVTSSIIDIQTLYGNLGVVERVYGQLEGAPVIVRRTPMRLNIPKPGGGLMVATKWMVSLGVDAAAVAKRYGGGAFLAAGNDAAAALPAGRPQLVVGKGDGSAGDEYESLTVSVQHDEDDIAEIIDDDDDLFSDKEKFVAAMERAGNPESVIAAAQTWVPRYRTASVHQVKNGVKSVSKALGMETWPGTKNPNMMPLRRKIAEGIWAYAVLRDTGTEGAEALTIITEQVAAG